MDVACGGELWVGSSVEVEGCGVLLWVWEGGRRWVGQGVALCDGVEL